MPNASFIATTRVSLSIFFNISSSSLPPPDTLWTQLLTCVFVKVLHVCVPPAEVFVHMSLTSFKPHLKSSRIVLCMVESPHFSPSQTFLGLRRHISPNSNSQTHFVSDLRNFFSVALNFHQFCSSILAFILLLSSPSPWPMPRPPFQAAFLVEVALHPCFQVPRSLFHKKIPKGFVLSAPDISAWHLTHSSVNP